MKSPAHRFLMVAACLVATVSHAGEFSDARNPEEWWLRPDPERRSLSRWPKHRILQLEAERAGLLEQLQALPRHNPAALPDRLGYHSLIVDHADSSAAERWIEVRWVDYYSRLYAVAFAPAYNSMDPQAGTYAFPKRFSIEALVMPADERHPLTLPKRTGPDKWVTLVNWLNEDCPDPGYYPLYFSVPDILIKKLRMTVPFLSGNGSDGFFALGELYLFRRSDSGDKMGDNMAVWGAKVEISASDSLSMPPLWDLSYLRDSAVGFGLPLSGKLEVDDDLMITFDAGEPTDGRVEMMLDLGQTQPVGRLELWPAEAPSQIAVPMFGFPGKIVVEISTEPDFSNPHVIEMSRPGMQLFHDNLVTIICKGYEGRYIRLTLSDLAEFKGKRILGLGEISAMEFGKVLSDNTRVTATGIPARYLADLPRLVDGYSRRCRILSEGEWIKGLAMRRPLDYQLAQVETELVAAKESWHYLQLRLSVWGIVLLLASSMAGLGFLRWQRRLGLKKLRQRMTRDLHDEVGSSLGSISLMADRVLNMIDDARAKAAILDLSLLSREACASLREVVWVVDQSTIRLPGLIGKLAERAERVMKGMELFIDIPQDCPDIEVSLTFKRHLIMYFKESVHNCVRHANATHAWVAFAVDGGALSISVRDDGCGFDPDAVCDGWGLDSMRERAKEMRAAMAIRSRPGEGTSIILEVPLGNLGGEPSRPYSTSNE